MSTQNFNYIFNVTGNASTVLNSIDNGLKSVQSSATKATSAFGGFEKLIVVCKNAANIIQGLNNALSCTIQPAMSLDSSLKDLSAITGETGEGLKLIEKYARQSARTFGGSAAQAVESYKLVLSQLSPEIAKCPEALRSMGDHIAVLSKTMGGNATAAAEVLTTAMNQFGVDLSDPIRSAEVMAEMMNVMAAAGREGSAELPQIKQALEQCGMAAKGANVSFEEANAAIQVLDKAGKKGAEGGVALRNALTILGQGRFMPKDVREELAAAGVDVNVLADSSIRLTDRLRMLAPVMNDAALFGKLFGRENVNAAMALVQGTAEIDRLTLAIGGTNTAYEQAEIVMDSMAEKQSRFKATIDNLYISLSNLVNGAGVYLESLMPIFTTTADLIPLFSAVGNSFVWIKNKITATDMWIKMVANIKGAIVATTMNLQLLNASATASGGWLKMMGQMGVSACRSIGIAIMNIPIVGWIAAAVAGLVALFATLWEKCKGFRVAVFTLWEGIKALFSGIVEWFGNIFTSIGNFFASMWQWLSEMFNRFMTLGTKILAPFQWAFGQIKSLFTRLFNWITAKFDWLVDKIKRIVPKEWLARGREAADRSWEKDHPTADVAVPTEEPLLAETPSFAPISTTTPIGIGSNINSVGSASAEKHGGSIKNINVNIESLVEQFNVTTNNLQQSSSQIKDMVARVLIDAVNDLNYAI